MYQYLKDGHFTQCPLSISCLKSCLFVVAQGEEQAAIESWALTREKKPLRFPHDGSALYWLDPDILVELVTDKGDPWKGSRNCRPSPNSDARYSVWLGSPGLYVGLQTLTPNGKSFAHTSCHYHNGIFESWLVVDGTGVLCTRECEDCSCWMLTEIAPGDIVTVSPRTEHQIRTHTGISTILTMKSVEPRANTIRTDTLPNFFLDHTFVVPP